MTSNRKILETIAISSLDVLKEIRTQCRLDGVFLQPLEATFIEVFNGRPGKCLTYNAKRGHKIAY